MHNYRNCKIIDYGLICACDECNITGPSELDGWILKPDGRTLCMWCNEKEDLPQA